jgi:hypothetical protein
MIDERAASRHTSLALRVSPPRPRSPKAYLARPGSSSVTSRSHLKYIRALFLIIFTPHSSRPLASFFSSSHAANRILSRLGSSPDYNHLWIATLSKTLSDLTKLEDNTLWADVVATAHKSGGDLMGVRIACSPNKKQGEDEYR